MQAPQIDGNSTDSQQKAVQSPASNGAPSTAAEASLPRRFERFTLLRQIARGGMGEVFLGTSAGIEGAERPVVVKIIRREHAEDSSFLARFLDEARIQAQLQHPGVAQVIEAATDGAGKPYVVVEHVEGRNLGEVRGRAAQLGARVGWADAVAIAVSMADALAHVHERTDASGAPLSIVHRDLSPQNVMVGYQGDVKLIDFGTARGENRRCHTVAGIVFAKPGYVAPEVANNTPGGPPADIYALGIMLWELVAGRRFLSGEASQHLAAVAAGERVPPPLAAEVGAPRELDSVLARLTATRIEERYATARDATLDLVMLLKRAPSLSDGERSVRGRVAQLMQRLYPSEPARSRAEFTRLVAAARTAGALRPAEAARPGESKEASDDGTLPGTRYRTVREIGRGAMGVVYEGFHADLGRTVAIKVQAKELAACAQKIEHFRAEARAIAHLQHENLVRLYDFGLCSDGRPYYAMELLEGETLDKLIEREHAVSWQRALGLGIQACRALEAAHGAGVVHRDIKPANLLLTSSGTLKLLDFGVAKARTEPAAASDEHSPSALSLVGTPEYMAPEQVAGGGGDERSDLYALGVVLYELITGTRPHSGTSPIAVIDAKLRGTPESPRERSPRRGIPSQVDTLILRALSRTPSLRYRNAAEMREALEQALIAPVAARRARRRAGVVAVSALMTALIAGGVVLGRHSSAAKLAKSAVDGIERQVRALRTPAPLRTALASSAERVSEALEQRRSLAAAADPAGPAAASDGEPAELLAADSVEAPPQDDSDALEVARTGETELLEPGGESAEPAGEEPSSGAEPPPELLEKIEAAEALLQQGKELRAIADLRKLGQAHPRSGRVLKAWSEAAVRIKAWGEAVRIARRWADAEPTLESRLHLARMERAVGKRERAVLELKRLVRDYPSSSEATELLAAFGVDPARVARR
ncbi:MAG TPA: serine/threonine-protein kinase [Polyangiaceae bacterium]|nr:serine/threonine-protein kinase [Polyangiaceae bacterium]